MLNVLCVNGKGDMAQYETNDTLRELLDSLEQLGASWEMETDSVRLYKEIKAKKEEIVAMFEAARAEQREADAKRLCHHCDHNAPAAWRHDLGWFHPTVLTGTAPCKAAVIRVQGRKE